MVKMKIVKKKQKYAAFTFVEMLITMVVLSIIFLAIGNVVLSMIKSSNLVSGRMLVREEGDYLAEVFRKYIRNSSADSVRLYFRENPTIKFSGYEVSEISSEEVVPYSPADMDAFATEIHFRPSGDSKGKVVCIGFFRDPDGIGYIVRTLNYMKEGESWSSYSPETCFPEDSPYLDDDFRMNFLALNSYLVHIEGLEIRREGLDAFGERLSRNAYYSIDIDMNPSWGVGGLSNYRSIEGSPTYRKSLVVQTRQLHYW